MRVFFPCNVSHQCFLPKPEFVCNQCNDHHTAVFPSAIYLRLFQLCCRSVFQPGFLLRFQLFQWTLSFLSSLTFLSYQELLLIHPRAVCQQKQQSQYIENSFFHSLTVSSFHKIEADTQNAGFDRQTRSNIRVLPTVWLSPLSQAASMICGR